MRQGQNWRIAKRLLAFRNLIKIVGQFLDFLRDFRKGRGHVVRRRLGPLDKLANDVGHSGRSGDKACLTLDARRRQSIFGAGDTPAAPVIVACHYDGIGTGIGMVRRFFGRLPFVLRAGEAPLLLVRAPGMIERRLGLQFVGGKLASQPAIVVNPDRFIESLSPVRHNALDNGPSSDRLYVNSLILVILRARHATASRIFPGNHGGMVLNRG